MRAHSFSHQASGRFSKVALPSPAQLGTLNDVGESGTDSRMQPQTPTQAVQSRRFTQVVQHCSCGKPRERPGRISSLFSTASCCHPQAVQHCWPSAGSLNKSRQQSIALCSSNSHRFSSPDLSAEELVEGSNQLLWWTLLDNGTHFVSKTY